MFNFEECLNQKEWISDAMPCTTGEMEDAMLTRPVTDVDFNPDAMFGVYAGVIGQVKSLLKSRSLR